MSDIPWAWTYGVQRSRRMTSGGICFTHTFFLSYQNTQVTSNVQLRMQVRLNYIIRTPIIQGRCDNMQYDIKHEQKCIL